MLIGVDVAFIDGVVFSYILDSTVRATIFFLGKTTGTDYNILKSQAPRRKGKKEATKGKQPYLGPQTKKEKAAEYAESNFKKRSRKV